MFYDDSNVWFPWTWVLSNLSADRGVTSFCHQQRICQSSERPTTASFCSNSASRHVQFFSAMLPIRKLIFWACFCDVFNCRYLFKRSIFMWSLLRVVERIPFDSIISLFGCKRIKSDNCKHSRKVILLFFSPCVSRLPAGLTRSLLSDRHTQHERWCGRTRRNKYQINLFTELLFRSGS